MHPARASAVRLAGGDGNGVWSAEEVIRTDAAHTPRKAPDYGLDFKHTMERLTEMTNLKPPGSFNVDTEYTHLTGTLGKRLDYMLANIDVGEHVHHTTQSDGLFLQVGSDPAGANSTHYWVVAELPLSRLGNAIRPPAYHRATFSRLEINLANREKRYENIWKAKPAVAAWLGSMHPALHAAYIGEGAYAAAAGGGRLSALLEHLPAALASITELATSGMRSALGAPQQQRGATQGGGAPATPGKRITSNIAPAARTHARLETWYSKAAAVGTRVRRHRKADLEQGDAGAQWAAHARRLALTATERATFVKHLETLARLQSELPHLEAVPGLWDAPAPSLGMMYLSTLSEFDAWIRAAFDRSTHHRTQRVLLQREADRAESDRHSAKLHG
jgi:hypothetical protein